MLDFVKDSSNNVFADVYRIKILKNAMKCFLEGGRYKTPQFFFDKLDTIHSWTTSDKTELFFLLNRVCIRKMIVEEDPSALSELTKVSNFFAIKAEALLLSLKRPSVDLQIFRFLFEHFEF